MRIICLANSFRTGGRCLGGIELDANNNPIFIKSRPKWIRPVCDTNNEQVPTKLVSYIFLLDIIEFQVMKKTGHGHQVENVLFNTNSLKVVDKFPFSELDKIIDNTRFNLVFGNRGAAVPEYKLNQFNYSLELLKLTNFETNERVFEDRHYPQIKLSFHYKKVLYIIPITDPVFLYNYEKNKSILENVQKIYVTFSLAAPNNEWSSKLVAGIITDDIINKKEKIDLNDFL